MADELTRRDFGVQSALALLSGVTITISACGSDPPPTNPSPPPAGPGNVQGTVSANHGHTAVITAAQITAGTNLVLTITGIADHPHTVALTSTDLGQIGAGTRLSKISSSEVAHNHVVTFN